jgi:ABC-2 type transport system permease protein
MTQLPRPAAAPPMSHQTRPIWWSVRREVWENRSLYLAPIGVGGFIFAGFIMSAIGLPARRRAVLLLDEARQRAGITLPYNVAAAMLLVALMIIGAFYCLDALYGERRDRSILFWKSLPVSDSSSVLAKALIPLVVLPLIIFAVIVAVHVLMLIWTSLLLLTSGMSPLSTFRHFHLLEQSLIHLYVIAAMVLWHAPLYGWILLVSAWARRAPLLWVVLPLFAIGAFERLALNSTHFAAFLKYRVVGMRRAFDVKAHSIDFLSQLTPWTFLKTPALWIGLAVAAAFIAAAVRLRRNREPI